jgi:hypothetical protein
MPKLEGTISISRLPPNRGLIVNLCFFAVAGPDAPAPYGGDPPTEAATDCDKVLEQVDLERESQDPAVDVGFSVERAAGYYYVQVRIILFQAKEGKMRAQAEQFFFGKRPLVFGTESHGNVTLPIEWPQIPLEDLHHYGTVSPQKKRPWWKFW